MPRGKYFSFDQSHPRENENFFSRPRLFISRIIAQSETQMLTNNTPEIKSGMELVCLGDFGTKSPSRPGERGKDIRKMVKHNKLG